MLHHILVQIESEGGSVLEGSLMKVEAAKFCIQRSKLVFHIVEMTVYVFTVTN